MSSKKKKKTWYPILQFPCFYSESSMVANSYQCPSHLVVSLLAGSLVRLVNCFSTSFSFLASGSLYPELPAGGELLHVLQKGTNTVKLDLIHYLRGAGSAESLLTPLSQSLHIKTELINWKVGTAARLLFETVVLVLFIWVPTNVCVWMTKRPGTGRVSQWQQVSRNTITHPCNTFKSCQPCFKAKEGAGVEYDYRPPTFKNVLWFSSLTGFLPTTWHLVCMLTQWMWNLEKPHKYQHQSLSNYLKNKI